MFPIGWQSSPPGGKVAPVYGICKVMGWIKNNSRPGKSEVRGNPFLVKYRRVFKHLVIRDGILWRRYRITGHSTILQAVVPDALIPQILPQVHGSIHAGHYGVHKTLQKTLQLYFWPLMYRDVLEFCKSCLQCQRDRNPVPRFRAPLKSVIATRPFEIVAVDILELGLTSLGNRYVLVITDYFTKYVNMYPLKDQKRKLLRIVCL